MIIVSYWLSLARSIGLRNHDQFFLKPFQINSQNGANKFDLVCKLAACKVGSWNQSGVCELGSTCDNRYNIFNTKPALTGRRRRQATNDVIEEDTQQVTLNRLCFLKMCHKNRVIILVKINL